MSIFKTKNEKQKRDIRFECLCERWCVIVKRTEFDYEYDYEYKLRTSAELSNIITSYMTENELAFEILDMAYEDVKDVFKRNAIIRRFKENE